MREGWGLIVRDRRIAFAAIGIGMLAAVARALALASAGSLDSAPLASVLPAALSRSLLGGGIVLLAAVLTAATVSAFALRGTGDGSRGLREGVAGTPALVRLLRGGTLLIAVGLLALVLAPYTAGIAVVAFAYFFLYVMPAAASGASAASALAESVHIASGCVPQTAAAVATIVAVAAAGWCIEAAMWRTPLAGAIVAQVLLQLAVAVASLAAVATVGFPGARNGPHVGAV